MSLTLVTNFALATVMALLAQTAIGSPWWVTMPAGFAVGFIVMLAMIHLNPEPRK